MVVRNVLGKTVTLPGMVPVDYIRPAVALAVERIVVAAQLAFLDTGALSLFQSRNGRTDKNRKMQCGLNCTHYCLFPLVCFTLFFSTDGLILKLAKEPSFLLSFLGGIGRSLVFFWYHAGAIMAIEGVATGSGRWSVLRFFLPGKVADFLLNVWVLSKVLLILVRMSPDRTWRFSFRVHL